MGGLTDKADVTGSGFVSKVADRSGEPIGGAAGDTSLGIDVVVSASLFTSTVGLVKPPGSETIGEGFCTFDDTVASEVVTADICEPVTVSGAEEPMSGTRFGVGEAAG